LKRKLAATESRSAQETIQGGTLCIQAQEDRVQVMKRTPLEGIRVISLGTGGVVPDCVKLLGEMGADVIKIESKQNLDMMRTIGEDINGVAGFNETNRNKRSFGVNLKAARGCDLVKELIKTSAVVTESFRAGVVDKLGLDYERVREIKPDIVYLSSQGFGKTGPYREHKAYGPLMAAASGMLRLWAHPDDPYPAGSTAPIPDHFASKHGVLAVLAALDYRRRTGKGQFIDMSLVEVGANLIGASYLEYTVNGSVPQPLGNRIPYAAPYGLYRCKGKDQWCAISVSTEEEWQCFCRAIGRSEWIEDDRFADAVSRLRNVDELDARIEEWTSQHEPTQVMNTLQAAGVAAGVAARSVDALTDPQLDHLKALVEVDHPVAGRRMYPGIPFKITGMAFPESRGAPLFGEHTVEICREILQLPEDEIGRLADEGVIEIAGHVPEEEPTR
jgi:benzylsuccinate CoA-transferase BbsF subunit